MGENDRTVRGPQAISGGSIPAHEDVRREDIITLVEEHATVTKRMVETGLVRVRTETETVDHVESAELGIERIEVERRPVNAWVDAIPPLREEGDITILPVVEERLVVEKRLFVTEEIHIRRVRSTERVELPVALRRQYAVVERLAPESGDATASDAPPSIVNK